MRLFLITTIFYFFGTIFAQNLQKGKKYKTAIIFFGNGPGLEVNNLKILDNNTITYGNTNTYKKLSKISLIQVKNRTPLIGGAICSGYCGLSIAYFTLRGLFSSNEYEIYNQETKEYETKSRSEFSAKDIIVFTTLYVGISFGIGWISGHLYNLLVNHSLDHWEVIYSNQKNIKSNPELSIE